MNGNYISLICFFIGLLIGCSSGNVSNQPVSLSYMEMTNRTLQQTRMFGEWTCDAPVPYVIIENDCYQLYEADLPLQLATWSDVRDNLDSITTLDLDPLANDHITVNDTIWASVSCVDTNLAENYEHWLVSIPGYLINDSCKDYKGLEYNLVLMRELGSGVLYYDLTFQ